MPVQSLTYCARIQPGRTDAWIAFNQEVHGARAAEHAASRARMGMTREVVSLQRTTHGDYLAVFMEAEDLEQAYRMLATSADPFDVWFRDHMIELVGVSVDMFIGALPSVLYTDWSAAQT